MTYVSENRNNKALIYVVAGELLHEVVHKKMRNGITRSGSIVTKIGRPKKYTTASDTPVIEELDNVDAECLKPTTNENWLQEMNDEQYDVLDEIDCNANYYLPGSEYNLERLFAFI